MLDMFQRLLPRRQVQKAGMQSPIPLRLHQRLVTTIPKVPNVPASRPDPRMRTHPLLQIHSSINFLILRIFADFNQNRFWIHRHQFSIDFGMWGFYLCHMHCVPPSLRVTCSRRPMKPVYLNRSNQVRRPRVNTCMCCHVEDPWMKIHWIKTTTDVL